MVGDGANTRASSSEGNKQAEVKDQIPKSNHLLPNEPRVYL